MPFAGGCGAGVMPVPAPSPHFAVRGMQTLCWTPSTVLAGVQLRSALHSLPFGHVGAQNESPPSWTQRPPAQSPSVTQSTHEPSDASMAVPPDEAPDAAGASPFDVAHAASVSPQPTTKAAANASA
jgi:hypothetical protein